MKKFLIFWINCTALVFISTASAEGQSAITFEKIIPQLMTVPNIVDSNQDKEISTQEILDSSQQLLKLDKDGDGRLDSEEIGAYAQDLPLVRNHFVTNVIDADGDISISADEISNAPVALRLLDRNGDWHISQSETKLGAPIDSPIFKTWRMDEDTWKMYRTYTNKVEGPIPPGTNSGEYKGYTLVHDAGDSNLFQVSNQTYLLDENGNRVHQWKHNGFSPEASVAYLTPDGKLLRTYSKGHWIDDKHFPVGATSTIELVAWNGDVLWDFSMSVAKKYSFHHDVEYLPNGNILAVRYTAFTKEEAMAMGWNPELGKRSIKQIDKTGSGLIWMDAVLELKPSLEDGSTQIVWQWNSWDHLVQAKYPNKNNFGDIKNPHKIHVNYLNYDVDVPFNSGQFYHMNTVDYNPDLDMIVVSSPTFGEVWFIDHSTTMQEAAGSSGGKHGMGGDLIYRWGNDSAFGKGTRDESTLYWQHDIQWIEKGLPGEGNMLVFNNGNRRSLDGKYIKEADGVMFGNSYSDILEVKMPMTKQGKFDRNKTPSIVWSWQEENRGDYFSPFMSGVQRLPNGNTIFCRAYDKYITEVTSQGDKVAHYSLEGWGRLYRIYKFGPDYTGLKF